MVAAVPKRFTTEEYLALEEKAEFKSELINGEIIPMAGASANHNKLALNWCRLFPLEINSQSYEVFMSDMRLWLKNYGNYTYPDVMVVKGEPIFTDDRQTAIGNPTIIVEVLSNSTQGYDHAKKFQFYRSIPEFQEYILISQSSYCVEQYAKLPDNRWLLTEFLGLDSILKLSSVDFEIKLIDLYKRVTFSKD